MNCTIFGKIPPILGPFYVLAVNTEISHFSFVLFFWMNTRCFQNRERENKPFLKKVDFLWYGDNEQNQKNRSARYLLSVFFFDKIDSVFRVMVTNQTFCPNIEVLLRTRQCYYLRRNWPNPLCSTFWDFLEWLDWQKPPLHDWVGSVVFAAKHWYWNSGVVWHVYCKEKIMYFKSVKVFFLFLKIVVAWMTLAFHCPSLESFFPR